MTTDEQLTFQIETVSSLTGASDYINEKRLLFEEYDRWRNRDRDKERTETAVLLRRDGLQEAYDAIDHDVIIVNEPRGRDHPDADLVIRVYDGYNE